MTSLCSPDERIVVRAPNTPRPLRVIASEAKQSIPSLCRHMDCFASLAMTAENIGHKSTISRRIAPEVCISFLPLKSEGAGKTGCLLHPRSRVRFAQTKLHTSIQGSGNTPAFPAQWLYGLLRALPGERLFCHRRCAGNQPHATCRQHRGVRTTRLRRTRQARTSIAPSASIASHRTFVTMANAPHLP